MDQLFIQRSDKDFLRRSMPGIFMYAIVWPALVFSTDLYNKEPTFSLIFSILLIGISQLRLIHAYSTRFYYATHEQWWRRAMFFLSYCHAITLSTLGVLVINLNQYQNVIFGTLIITIAILSGAASSLAPKLRFTQIYIAILTWPGVLACYLSVDFQFLAPLYLICWLYFVLTARRFHGEYYRAYKNERRLKENKDTLEKLNKTDALTGIFNRQYFDNALHMQWDLASRSNSDLSILFLDLDFFKKINDQYGHLVGDDVLCYAANLLKEQAKRTSDMIARYGGEEFAIILPCTHHTDAMDLATTIQKKFAYSEFKSEGICIKLTISIGVNCVQPSSQQSWLSFLDQADQALYQAKANGRNCVISYLDTVCDITAKKNQRL